MTEYEKWMDRILATTSNPNLRAYCEKVKAAFKLARSKKDIPCQA